jgi:hypothetical protein
LFWVDVFSAHVAHHEDRFYAHTEVVGLVCSVSADSPEVRERYNLQ